MNLDARLKKLEQSQQEPGEPGGSGYQYHIGFYEVQNPEQVALMGGGSISLTEFELLPGPKFLMPSNHTERENNGTLRKNYE